MEIMKPRKWVFLRGLARETRHWGDFPSLFEKSFAKSKVYVLELPGVGKKYRQKAPTHLSQYTDSLRDQWKEIKKDEKNWGLLGLSMGAMISMDWVSRYPKDFRSLVLINSSAGNLSRLTERFSLQAIREVGKLLFHEDYKKREKIILELTTKRIRITDDLIKTYSSYDEEFPIGRINFIRQIFAASRFKVPQELEIPPLILNGKQDALASPSCSKILAQHFGVKLYQDPESGHDLPLDNPQWIIETLSGKFGPPFPHPLSK